MLPKTVWFTIGKELNKYTQSGLDDYPQLIPSNPSVFRACGLQESGFYAFEQWDNDRVFSSAMFQFLQRWGCDTIAIRRDGFCQFYTITSLIDNMELSLKLFGI